MQYTTNYNLKKPDLTDPVDIGDINDNMDEIDSHLSEMATKIIKETGNNANGNYVKFEDGTLICYTELTIAEITASAVNVYGSTSGTTYYGSTTWTFPASFINNPIAFSNSDFSAYTAPFTRIRSITTSNCIAIALAGDNSKTNVPMQLFAIGRWKA